MNCRDIEPLLTSYLLGELDTAQAEQVQTHLASCKDCQASAKELEATLHLMRNALAVPSHAPVKLDATHRERIQSWRMPELIYHLVHRRLFLVELAAAAGIVAILGLLVMPSMTGSMKMAARTQDQAIEVNMMEMEPVAPPPQMAEMDRVEDKELEQLKALPYAVELDNPLPVERPAKRRRQVTTRSSDLYASRSEDISGYKFAAEQTKNEKQKASSVLHSDVVGYAALAPAAAPATISPDLGMYGDRSGGLIAGAESAERSSQREVSPSELKKLVKLDELRPVEDTTLPPEATVTLDKELAGAGAAEGFASDNDSMDFGSALDIRSDVQGALVMKGLYQGRSASGRAAGLKGYAGRWAGHTEPAVQKALMWLKENQQPDGSWNHAEPGVASLGLLAMLGHGETTSSDKYGQTVEKALHFLLSRQNDAGIFSPDPGEHALATYALSEAYSLTRIPALKAPLEKAVTALVRQQPPEALATANPWAVLALKSSSMAKVDIPDLPRVMDQVADRLETEPGTRAALGLQLLGRPQDAQVRLDESTHFAWSEPRSLEDSLQTTHAKFNAGGSKWDRWNNLIASSLVKVQNADGSWPARTDTPSRYTGPAASTALSTLMMEVYYRYLPTFQASTFEPSETNDVVVKILGESPPVSTEPVFKAYGVNPYVETATNRFSTFSIDVDTASYTLCRRYIQNGYLPPAEAVRTEEFLNFFDYGYRTPEKEAFAIYTEAAPAPFGPGLLLKIGIQGQDAGLQQARIFTLVIDTSGSMATADRLGLARRALHILIDQLHPQDRVAIVQYSTQARLVLEHTSASEKDKILKTIYSLQTSGSTHLEEGIKLGYAVAARGFRRGAVNRVMLFSDGVANLGSASSEEILGKISDYRKQGIFCSVYGFGKGTYDDIMLESLADHGDGTYQFIDSLAEAERVFQDQIKAMQVLTADTKIQVEFNPSRVKQFRQIGYENRKLREEDFRNDSVDAGEVGVGQSVTALYELIPDGRETEPIGTVRIRYRNLNTGRIEEVEHRIEAGDVKTQFQQAGAAFKLAAAVAEFAEILRGSPYAEGGNFGEVANVLRPIAMELNLDTDVQELLSMMQKTASGLPRSSANK